MMNHGARVGRRSNLVAGGATGYALFRVRIEYDLVNLSYETTTIPAY